MSATGKILALAAGAGVSLAALLMVLHFQRFSTPMRWVAQAPAHPEIGAGVFAGKCGQCHDAVAPPEETESGQRKTKNSLLAPQLSGTAAVSGLPMLVTAMWNHAPQVWDMLDARNLPYPSLSYEEMSQVTAYLYLSGAGDPAGDPVRGRGRFEQDGCVRCHDAAPYPAPSSMEGHVQEGRTEKRFIGCDNTLDCTQSLWNHAAAMRAHLEEAQILWPRFDADDLRDLFAYTGSAGGYPKRKEVLGSPEAGWRVFQERGCIRCHAAQSEGGAIAPQLGADPRSGVDLSLSQFGASLLNHLPEMQVASGASGYHPPVFQAHELTDLAVFLYGLKYAEPSGVAAIGQSVFVWRRCSQCHGADALGKSAPALRGRGRTFTAARLAADLWRHGAGMYTQSKRSGQPWPVLQEADVGHLISFLNTAPE